MKLWSTLGAPIKRLGRWNFSSFAVERVSRKHREMETRKRKIERVTKEQERKTRTRCERKKEKEQKNGERLWNCDLPSISRRNWFTAITNAAGLRTVPAIRLCEEKFHGRRRMESDWFGLVGFYYPRRNSESRWNTKLVMVACRAKRWQG